MSFSTNYNCTYVHLAVCSSHLRWDSLLRCGSRVLGLSLSDPKMLDFCDSMVLNNVKTGNFGTLLTLMVAAVDEVHALFTREIKLMLTVSKTTNSWR